MEYIYVRYKNVYWERIRHNQTDSTIKSFNSFPVKIRSFLLLTVCQSDGPNWDRSPNGAHVCILVSATGIWFRGVLCSKKA